MELRIPESDFKFHATGSHLTKFPFSVFSESFIRFIRSPDCAFQLNLCFQMPSTNASASSNTSTGQQHSGRG
jgi:hypothetical protein